MQINAITKQPGGYLIEGARAVDGDTVEAVVILPFGTMVMKRIRLKGWWAPELTGANSNAGLLAKTRLQAFLSSTPCAIISRAHRQDKYGRIIADLWALGRVISPQEVLGLFALSEAEHKREHDLIKKGRESFAATELALTGDECPECGWVHRGIETCYTPPPAKGEQSPERSSGQDSQSGQ